MQEGQFEININGILNTHIAIDKNSLRNLDKYKTNMDRDSSVRIATGYGAGRFGDRIPVSGEMLRN
jgi:hypothetical protein